MTDHYCANCNWGYCRTHPHLDDFRPHGEMATCVCGDPSSESWQVWTYALRPGWDLSESHATRECARWVRAELVESDGYEPNWVAIRKIDAGPPRRKPTQASIAKVERDLVMADG